MITTNKKNKVVTRLYFSLFILLFSSCYQGTNGCLDITAANYDASADEDCEEDETAGECPCEYNTLEMNIDLVYDTLSYSLNDTIPLSDTDTLKVIEGHLVLSNFCLKNTSDKLIKTETNYDINGDGEDLEYNDLIVYRFSSGSLSVGELKLKDTISEINFLCGIVDEINNSNYDFSENDEISRLIDSSYVNDQNQIAAFRIKYQNIQLNDTTDYQSILFLDPTDYRYAFPLVSIINYDDNPTLNLSADIKLLFKDINLGEEDTDLKMIENLKKFVSLKE
jgi:hypothetical protein